jgi:hypothetical protein
MGWSVKRKSKTADARAGVRRLLLLLLLLLLLKERATCSGDSITAPAVTSKPATAARTSTTGELASSSFNAMATSSAALVAEAVVSDAMIMASQGREGV